MDGVASTRALGYTWHVLIQTLALPLVNSTWPPLAKSRCLTQRAGVFSNPSVDAGEGMAWQGTVVDWGVSGMPSLSPRVKGPGPQSERATGLVGPCLLAAEQACLHAWLSGLVSANLPACTRHFAVPLDPLAARLPPGHSFV
ncbi:hypothetical protein CEP54_008071 [Fusarium duplospermum]|uniref:Uncharacterized protein n=1 Tax=Fusarium duplospermum TaxID=1325734 RepID=A0A428PY35_9HYPO|nr:hypothetical protein CEP54_008071 [Fusarium duplospermum]